MNSDSLHQRRKRESGCRMAIGEAGKNLGLSIFFALLSAVITYVIKRVLDAWGILDPAADAFGRWAKLNITSDQAAWTVALVVGLIIYGIALYILWRHSSPARADDGKGGEESRVSDLSGHGDVWLHDAIWRIWSGREWGKPTEVGTSGSGLRPEDFQRVHDISADQIRQRAFEGTLPLWGKRLKSDLWEPIPKEFWQDHQVNYLFAFERDQSALRTEIRIPGASNENWRALRTRKSNVETLWPPQRKPSSTLVRKGELFPDIRIEEGLDLIEANKVTTRSAEMELRDALSLGRVHAWARRFGNATPSGLPPLVAISPATWETMTFHVMRPSGRKPISRIVEAVGHGTAERTRTCNCRRES